MKKLLIITLLLTVNIAHAQEDANAVITSFWKDKIFLILVSGAVFLIILLIIKKIMDKRAYKKEEKYEDSNL